LYALKTAVKGSSKSLSQGSFTHAGNVFNQQVAPGNQSNNGQANGFRFTFYYRLDCSLQPLDSIDGFGGY